MKMNKCTMEEQRAITDLLVYKLTGEKIQHSKTGRPFVGKPIDISVSHKDKYISAAYVTFPYKIGLDIENLKAPLNAKLFLGSIIKNHEILLLKKICKKNNFSHSSGVILFWSIKESFFKCLDYCLKPGKIDLLGISKKGIVKLSFSDEIKNLMKKRKLEFCSTRISFKNGYVFSQTIMKKESANHLD